ncbi:MAG: ribosome biogenesis GTPase Der [Deltaproteobacteria bacterium CG_4_8_14_3_um_filter_43_13]|nr:MAG: ribosome biogenesis GTPase Der [Deltaproteobacteria bacterium CG06_land_8_20_14_3_00_44_19]PIX25693.1 MAG: ribosome biogenesis GTPase Der [Deltaproteobacteria bacterium CG_4_8_14_3_um_filter_43_13]PIZ19061.1 MAG: ribosome biogenesis GTPase Der [Deltaproteobacteria bacterium CG_4_10_14_0_8_um_filter_43_12]
MKPIIAIVGRPNVGKSTLFNRIARRKKAIVGDEPGVTRDRNYAEAEWNGGVFLLIDTGGFEPGVNDEVALHIHQQVQLAIEEADLIIFLVDGKEGLTSTDIEIAKRLREVNKPVLHVINKIDGERQEEEIYDFYRIGVENLYPISAQHGRGVGDLLDEALNLLPPSSEIRYNESLVKIAVLGRPNVGKSSLVNRILGNERVIVSEKPGTTRDAIDTPLKIGEKEYLLIDTAGIRRKGRISRQLEKYSVVEALKSIDRCDVAVILIDAKEGITEQDAKIAGLAHDKGRASVLVVNKWDLIEKDSYTIYKYTEDIRYNLKFIRYAPIIFVSALTGQRALKIIDLVDRVAEQYQRRVPTSELNRVFEEVILSNPPPMYRNKELKLYYITQVSIKPPAFVIFVNYPEGIHFSYERYIVNKIRENFEFDGTPVRVFFRKRG